VKLFNLEGWNPYSPLQNIEYALAFKPISRKTQESINRSKASWVTNIANMAGVSTS